MTRVIYLIVYNSLLFPAHWTLWIPTEANPQIGKGIHVTGDAVNRFQHEFKRNYDLSEEDRAHRLFLLAQVDDRWIADVPADGSFSVDTTPADDVETIALSMPAPGKSLRTHAGSTVSVLMCILCRFLWSPSGIETNRGSKLPDLDAAASRKARDEGYISRVVTCSY